MPRKTRKVQRKGRKFTRRMRGGGTTVCPTPEDSETNINIVEDQLKVANPQQSICYGDTITSCTTLTVVLEDNWKVGLHINPATYELSLQNLAPKQTYTPENIVAAVKDLLNTNDNVKGKKIKSIYLLGDSHGYYAHGIYNKKQQKYVGFAENNSTLNNANTKKLREVQSTIEGNTNSMKRQTDINMKNAVSFFKTHFGADRFLDPIDLVVNPKITISDGNHYIIKADGMIDLVTTGLACKTNRATAPAPVTAPAPASAPRKGLFEGIRSLFRK